MEPIVDLFSQSPGSLIYHFCVLFAMEAALGIALGYRRRPAVRRVALATGGILVGRLALMVVALLDVQGLIDASTTVLPPLERAVDGIGVWLLVWALLPLFDRLPQWGNGLAGGGVLVLVALYLFFAIAWYGQATGPAPVPFNGSSQDLVWTLIQLGLLGTAATFTLFGRGRDWVPRFFIFAIPLAAHLAHFAWGSSGGDVAGWVRLGQLISYPLVTVWAYRLVFSQLLADAVRPPAGPAVDLEQGVRGVSAIAEAQDEPAVLAATVKAVALVTGAGTVALLSMEDGEGAKAELCSLYRDGQADPDLAFTIGLHDAPVLRRAARNLEPVWLTPGAQDDPSRLFLLMHLLPETGLKARLKSALLIQPVCRPEENYGMLVVQPEPGSEEWPAKSRQMVGSLAAHAATALARLRAERDLQQQVGQLEEKAGAGVRLGEVQAELDQARAAQGDLTRQAEAARAELAKVKREAKKLAPLIKASEQQRNQIARLQQELAALAELNQAPGPESPPERALQPCADPAQVTLAAQELRRPLASISGYTDLLLGESVGTVGELQRLFLQRVRASTERARVLLDDLVQATASEEPGRFRPQPVQMSEVVEEAVRRLGNQIEARGVKLQVNLQESLPQLEIDRPGIEQILYHLLSNAVQATREQGVVSVDIRYQMDSGIEVGASRLEASGYLFVSVVDSGNGVRVSDLANVFDRHYRSTNPPINGLGETDLGLPLVKDLLQAQGGRIWIESEPDVGSTLSMVLPAVVARR